MKENRIEKLLMTMLIIFCSMFVVTNCKITEVKAAKTVNAGLGYGSAPKIKKRGTYNINVNGSRGFIKFKAPKKGTYTITVYNTRDWGKTSAATNGFGHYWISKYTKNEYYPTLQYLKTNYGKSTTFRISSKWWYKRFGKPEGKTVDAHLYSRYVKIKLKKGETIFIGADWGWGNKFKYTLKIK